MVVGCWYFYLTTVGFSFVCLLLPMYCTATSISQRRFITLFDLPMFVYAVTNIPGKSGYVAVSSIASAQGETEPSYTFLSDGEVIHLDLQNHFDTLVEFVNCVVWWDENSEG